MTFFGFIIISALMLVPKDFTEAKNSVALYLIPTSVVQGIGGTQAIFVLIYALIFGKVWPNLFKEYLDRKEIFKKVVLFIAMIVGIIFITSINNF